MLSWPDGWSIVSQNFSLSNLELPFDKTTHALNSNAEQRIGEILLLLFCSRVRLFSTLYQNRSWAEPVPGIFAKTGILAYLFGTGTGNLDTGTGIHGREKQWTNLFLWTNVRFSLSLSKWNAQGKEFPWHFFKEINLFTAFPCQEFLYLYLNTLYMYLFQINMQEFLSLLKFLVLVPLNP